MESNPLLSVVIPAYNAERTISACLASVLKQTYGNYEVVVVDNGSSDRTRDIVLGIKDMRLRCLHEEHRGRGAARNTGEMNARGRILLMTDTDCILPLGWIEGMIQPILSGEFDATQGIEEAALDGFWSRHIQAKSTGKIDGRRGIIGMVDTKNFAISSEALRKVGGTSRRYLTGEDTDLSIRLHQHKIRVKFQDNVAVKHFHSDSLRDILGRYFSRGFWCVEVTRNNRRLLEGTDFMEQTCQTPWSFIKFIPGLIKTSLSVGLGRAYFDLVTGCAWRAGLIWARVKVRRTYGGGAGQDGHMRDSVTQYDDAAGSRSKGVVRGVLSRVKVGKYRWGYIRHDVYEDLNRLFTGSMLPAAHLNRLKSSFGPRRIRKISVIIPTRDRLEALRKYALKSLDAVKLDDAEYEIIVVDNSPDDSPLRYLNSSGFRNLRIVREESVGAAAARNAGVKAASGDVLAFIDDDCYVDVGWLKRIYDWHNSGGYVLGQGYILNVGDNRVLNIPPQAEKERNFREGNISFRREAFDYVSFNENMPYAQEGWDLIGQLDAIWHDFPYFVDTVPIRHYCAESKYRNMGDYTPTPLGSALEIKMEALRRINKQMMLRNLCVDSRVFSLRYFLLEAFFFPLELTLIRFDPIILFRTKVRMYWQLRNIGRLGS